MSINPVMLKHIATIVNIRTHGPFILLHKSIYMILQELHKAYSNQLAASLCSETSSGDEVKLLAPHWHCFSAASTNS